jgi:acyl transferase domain-containing protein/3-hydroxymyristoyl/3-hydroxydecanoyl-(acyl carrier protein) dehydratase
VEQEPIAVVGRGCVVPDAFDPETFWANIRSGRCSLSPGGGFVRDFDSHFDPGGFALAPDEIMRLDPIYRWVLHAARQALDEAGRTLGSNPGSGLVLGNLCYPSVGLVRYAEGVWRDGRGPDRLDPRDRFSAGLPAHLAVTALGLDGGGFALDAACASTLYAVKLACDRLRDGAADFMLAGAVSCPDRLLMHDAFAALAAVSPTGQCRPFHRGADGITPSEGAVVVALMRLRDAISAHVPILGAIRAIGLSNDGRTGGLLVPAREGQERAMGLAYAAAGFAPETVSLVECHATGTPVGDRVEARSMAAVFAGTADLPVGSVKSNVGHLLAAAGGAGLLKVLGALRDGVRPASLGANDPIEEFENSPLRLLASEEEWPGPQRRAAVSAFGFGGTNAHLIVDAWPPPNSAAVTGIPVSGLSARRREDPVAITAIGARVADGADAEDFRRAVLLGERHARPRSVIDVGLGGLRIPPRDLEEAHAQHVLLFEAAREATQGRELPRERTTVIVGMGVDPEVARYPVAQRASTAAGAAPLTGAAVLGTMPNIIANRVNLQLNLAGPGYVVCAEEGSGLVALQLAARALRRDEADAAIVGAVDLSFEPVHEAAVRSLDRDQLSGDAAIVVILERLSDARQAGRQVLAVLDDDGGGETPPAFGVGDFDARDGTGSDSVLPGDGNRLNPAELFGKAHAACGMVALATAVTAVRHRAIPRIGELAIPVSGPLGVEVAVDPLGAPRMSVRLRAEDPAQPWAVGPAPRLWVYSGPDRAGVLGALAAGRESDAGPARLAIVGNRGADRPEPACSDAVRCWLAGDGPRPDGVAYRNTPVGGETAFVFTNGSAAYPGMGAELALAFPALADAVEDAQATLRPRLDLPRAGATRPGVISHILGASLLGGLHVRVSRDLLGIRPDAAIGYSSGETAALAALGAWTEPAAAYREFRASELFSAELAGEFRAVRRVWRRLGIAATHWATYLVNGTPDEIRDALSGEAAVHLMTINTPDTCVIGGEPAGCEAVLQRLGRTAAFPLDYGIAAHAPEVAEVGEEYRQLHLRPTRDVPGVRFYSAATGESYRASADLAADALLAQMCGTIDFVRLIERAWADGVRVFIEHGPQAQCTGWIRRILADREHVSLALDAPSGRGTRQLCQAVVELVAAGVPVAVDGLLDGLAAAAGTSSDPGDTIRIAAHPPAMRLPERDPAVTAMPRAPALAPVSATMTEPDGARLSGGLPSGVRPDGDGARAPVPVVPERIAAAYGRASPSPSVPAAPLSGVVGVVARQLQNVTALHRDYLAKQAQAHEQFLRGRQLQISAVLPQIRGSALVQPGTPHPLLRPHADPAFPPASGPAANWQTTAAVAAPRSRPKGPSFDRAQLEYLAEGRISELFGPRFSVLDDRPRQTRLPAPPMLLADRVTGIDAEPGSMGTGTIWTETDVTLDAWYLDVNGRMPAALMSEGGQADLLLISWLGIDLLSDGGRVYRLLGCELTYHGSPAVAGETLRYEISIDRHVDADGVRLFFFRYDCYVGNELRITLRNGQAGFFTDAELAQTDGLPWDPAQNVPADGSVHPPVAPVVGREFGRDEVRAFAEGRPADCFGPDWTVTRAHVRTPRIEDGRMLLLDTVTDVDPAGGPWRRGYLRAEFAVTADDWYFAGHFKNDPCMPGTLMFQGGLQAMAFYLAALGYTLDRDGWRFEPVTEEPCVVRCRRQVSPASREIVYEIFVSELSGGPCPTLYADILGTVDGVKAFHARRAALRLVPDWPLDYWRQLGPPRVQETGDLVPLADLGGLARAGGVRRASGAMSSWPDGALEPVVVDGVRQDYAALLACSWGHPTQAFGPGYARFDSHRHIPHLPGPPYHFMTRIVAADGPMGGMQTGTAVTAEYDVPASAWYFEQNGAATMPFAVIMEAALQTCGWLATYTGSVLSSEVDLRFRNLDGTGTVLREVTPETALLRTRAELRDISRLGNVIIESFTATTTAVGGPADGEDVFELDTVFGFFPKESLAEQPGLPASEEECSRVAQMAPGGRVVDLRRRPPEYCAGPARLPGPMLLMLDRITRYSPDGGRAGLGYVCAEKDVDAGEWYFKAHFFQDPVQPGSLGIQAMCHVLQWHLIESGAVAGVPDPQFEPIMTGEPVTWKYRGQVMPAARSLLIELDITGTGDYERRPWATADCWLWVDGQRIYQVSGLGMRVVPGRS